MTCLYLDTRLATVCNSVLGKVILFTKLSIFQILLLYFLCRKIVVHQANLFVFKKVIQWFEIHTGWTHPVCWRIWLSRREEEISFREQHEDQHRLSDEGVHSDPGGGRRVQGTTEVGPASPRDPGERLPVAGRLPVQEGDHPGPARTPTRNAELCECFNGCIGRQPGGTVHEVGTF